MTSWVPVTLDQLAARVDQLAARVDAQEAALRASATSDEGDEEPTELCFPDLWSFVRDFFAPTFGRPIGGTTRWCPNWYDHLEAMLRLEALWRAFESLRLDPQTGIATWLRDYVDHALPQLTSATGPFARCGTGHEPDKGLPVNAPPPDWSDLNS
jgi:hypothetical protein